MGEERVDGVPAGEEPIGEDIVEVWYAEEHLASRRGRGIVWLALCAAAGGMGIYLVTRTPPAAREWLTGQWRSRIGAESPARVVVAPLVPPEPVSTAPAATALVSAATPTVPELTPVLPEATAMAPTATVPVPEITVAPSATAIAPTATVPVPEITVAPPEATAPAPTTTPPVPVIASPSPEATASATIAPATPLVSPTPTAPALAAGRIVSSTKEFGLPAARIFKTGDIIFQVRADRPSWGISAVVFCPYNNVGVLEVRGRRVDVLSYTWASKRGRPDMGRQDFTLWVRQGVGEAFEVYRYRGVLKPEDIRNLVLVAERFRVPTWVNQHSPVEDRAWSAILVAYAFGPRLGITPTVPVGRGSSTDPATLYGDPQLEQIYPAPHHTTVASSSRPEG